MYARAGFAPVPVHGVNGERCACGRSDCPAVGKHPVGGNWQKRASSDIDATRELFADHSGNIGIVVGGTHVVVDIDYYSGGREGLATLPSMPFTLTSQSGSGQGEHRIFTYAPGQDPQEVTNRRIAPGVDIKTRSGQIVVAPSLHKSGNQYRWTDSTPPAPLPTDLYERIRKSRVIPIRAPATPTTADNVLKRATAYIGKIPGAIRGQGGHAAQFSAARACWGWIVKGLSESDGWALFLDFNSRCQPPLNERDARHKWDDARKADRIPVFDDHDRNPPRPPPTDTESEDRPEIQLTTEEEEVTLASISALAKHPEIYRRGRSLVSVAIDQDRPRAILRPPGSPEIVDLPQPRIRGMLVERCRFVQFVKPPKQEGEWRPAHPPNWLIPAVATHWPWTGVRHLETVVETPVLTPDGTILDTPGYDAATGIVYVETVKIPAIPSEPTRGDAAGAILELLEVIADFPCTTPAHRSAWVAGVLTPLCRAAFAGAAPLFMITANIRGAGKSTLADLASLILTGRPMPRTPPTENEDEDRKRILAIARSGKPLVLIDNIKGNFGSPSMDAALTSTEWTDRDLGFSKNITVPLLVSWWATGNNLNLVGDICRRICHIRLDSPEENPERRSGFRHADIEGYVLAGRGRLLRAALTILRAFCVAGRPDMQLPPWGKFEGWWHLVRDAIVWAGEADPGETRDELTASSDEDSENCSDLVTGWAELARLHGGSCTAKEALDYLELDKGGQLYGALRSALKQLCPTKNGALPTTKSLGWALKKFKGRVVGGRAIVCTNPLDTSGHGKLWGVRTVSEITNDAVSP